MIDYTEVIDGEHYHYHIIIINIIIIQNITYKD